MHNMNSSGTMLAGGVILWLAWEDKYCICDGIFSVCRGFYFYIIVQGLYLICGGFYFPQMSM